MTGAGVVPLLALGWSHAAGATQLKVVPCGWRATARKRPLTTFSARHHRVRRCPSRRATSRTWRASGGAACELVLARLVGRARRLFSRINRSCAASYQVEDQDRPFAREVKGPAYVDAGATGVPMARSRSPRRYEDQPHENGQGRAIRRFLDSAAFASRFASGRRNGHTRCASNRGRPVLSGQSRPGGEPSTR
jgi:hypothetical protein